MLEKIFGVLDLIPRIPLGQGIETLIDWLLLYIGDFTRAFSTIMRDAIISLNSTLMLVPPLIFIVALALLAWRMTNRYVALFTLAGLVLIYNMGLWSAAMQTLSLVIISALISVIIGLPVGIAGARSSTVHRIVWPVLDLMQTLPAFVYLIPVVFFFRLGSVPAVMATVIFAMPPVIRLTGLGIQQVPKEMVEASIAFGSTEWQKLVKVQLPLAKPTIMAGVNQCIMLCLSMVVIAAMIGAGGLGGEVWRSIQRLAIGTGFESGLAVVIVAVILDRITQSVRGDV